MVASPHALASAAGIDVLRRGGNAVDAAIAANAVLAVVYPASCGIGGDAFWIVHDPRLPDTVSYNGSGRTPRAASLERLPQGTPPQRGALTVTVPGAVRSWEDVGRTHGTRALDELLAPAERCAREGFAVTDVAAAYFASYEALLRNDPEATRIFLRDGIPRSGDVLRNPELAATLAAIGAVGADALYRGVIAQRIVAALRARGNAMTLDDLGEHRTEPTTPLRLPWNGGTLLAHPPNSQGACLLLAMGILAGDAQADDERWTHLAIEAVKAAIALRDASIADPAFTASDIAAELTPRRLRAMREGIDPQHASIAATAHDHGDTIAICAADENGMAVTLIESLYMPFGAGIVAEGTGIVLHNRGAYFSTQPGSPNVYAAAKRPLHTLSPGMFVRDGRAEIAFGAMGGDGQPQIQLQFLRNFVERGLDVQQSLDAPRWVYGNHMIPGRPEIGADTVIVESRIDPAIVAALERRGHRIAALGAYENAMGHAHAIAIDHVRGTFAGGSDPRADSAALGL